MPGRFSFRSPEPDAPLRGNSGALTKMLKRREFITFSPTSHAPPASYWQHVSRPAMACRFEVTLPLDDQAGVSAARQALDEVDRLEEQLTIFKESSEVSFINRQA